MENIIPESNGSKQPWELEPWEKEDIFSEEISSFLNRFCTEYRITHCQLIGLLVVVIDNLTDEMKESEEGEEENV